jgi:hypothetical protein
MTARSLELASWNEHAVALDSAMVDAVESFGVRRFEPRGNSERTIEFLDTAIRRSRFIGDTGPASLSVRRRATP